MSVRLPGTTRFQGWNDRSEGLERQIRGVGTTDPRGWNDTFQGLERHLPRVGTTPSKMWIVTYQGLERHLPRCGSSPSVSPSLSWGAPIPGFTRMQKPGNPQRQRGVQINCEW